MSQKHNHIELEKKFNSKLVVTTVLLVIVLMPAFSFVHEMGHVLSCEAAGRESNFSVGIMGSWATCSGTFEDPTVFRYAGGILAAGLAFVIFATIRHKLSGAWKGIGISLVSIGIVEYMGGVMEGFANHFYMNSPFAGAIQGLVLLSLVIFFVWRNSND